MATSAVLLSGCVKVTSQVNVQADVVGDVVLTTDLCQNGAYSIGMLPPAGRVIVSPSPTPSASPTPAPTIAYDANGCLTTELATGRPVEVFINYLVPDGTGTPATLTSAGSRGGTFTAMSAADSETLADVRPAPAGYHWQAYRSAKSEGLQPGEVGPASGTVTARFAAAGLAGDFKYVETIGWRWLGNDASDTAYAADRPIVCSGAMNGPEQDPGTTCADASYPSNILAGVSTGRGAVGLTESDYNLVTVGISRLSVTAPAASTAEAGTTARVTFSQTSSRAAALDSASVPVAGSSTIPGATVSTDGSLAIGSDAKLSADVAIPAGTPAGDYDVQLDAGTGSGLRTARATLRVTAKPVPSASPTPTPTPAPAPGATPKPVAAPTIPEQLAVSADDLSTIVQRAKKVGQLRRGAMTVPVKAPAAGTIRVSVVGRGKTGGEVPTYAVGSATAKSAGRIDVTVKRTAEGRELLRSGATIKATLVVRFWGAGGKVVTTGIPITLD